MGCGAFKNAAGEKCPLRFQDRESVCTPEICDGLFPFEKLRMEFPSHRMKQVVSIEAALEIERCECSHGPTNSRDGNGAIERDNRCGMDLRKPVIQGKDAWPVRRAIIRRSAVACGDGSLEMILAERLAVGGETEVMQPSLDHRSVPCGSILFLGDG